MVAKKAWNEKYCKNREKNSTNQPVRKEVMKMKLDVEEKKELYTTATQMLDLKCHAIFV